MAITFRIVENPTPHWESFIEEFSEEYNQYKLTTSELREKYGLSARQYTNLRKTARERGLIKNDKYYSPVPPRHYFFSTSHQRYIVSKLIKGRTMYYSSFKTEEEAKLCVKLLKECDWDKSQIKEIKEKVKEMKT